MTVTTVCVMTHVANGTQFRAAFCTHEGLSRLHSLNVKTHLNCGLDKAVPQAGDPGLCKLSNSNMTADDVT